MNAAAALETHGLYKQFHGTYALEPLDWRVERGEVHALVGQNGSGKSTLIKCLAGYHRPEGGRVTLYGRDLPLPVHNPTEHGIAVVHQDLGLAPQMTVLENIGVATRYGRRTLGWVNDRAELAQCAAVAQRLGLDLPLHALVEDLSPAERALVGLLRAVRALGDDHTDHLFILDEPTASLSRNEAAQVTDLMRRVADLGSSVIFVSHRLSEVLDNCDKVTVLRDGRMIGNHWTAGLSRTELVTEMLGQRLAEYYPPAPTPQEDADTVLTVEHLTGTVIDNLSLTVRAGEVVGVTGLAGMGQEELPLLLAGKFPWASGEVVSAGRPTVSGDPRSAVAAGIVLVPGNRHRDGCWVDASLAENVTLPTLGRYTRSGVVTKWNTERARALHLVAESGVVPLQPDWPIRNFSGGNQQKVVLAKWLEADPQVLLLDEPTQGVDAGAARELLDRVADLAMRGAAVVVFSGDHEQLAAICNRVLVLHEGRVTLEIPREDLDEQTLLEACEQGSAVSG